MTTNLKPADELLEIREKIKDLRKREDYIKDAMLSGALEMEGDFAIAEFKRQTRRTFDRKEAEKELGTLVRFEKASTFLRLHVTHLEPAE